MKVILVNGSPHKEGCTFTALSEVEKTLNEESIETEIFWIKTKPITGCIACLKCGEKGECAFDNDVVNEFVKKAYDADAFVFGSPVYYAGANGEHMPEASRTKLSETLERIINEGSGGLICIIL